MTHPTEAALALAQRGLPIFPAKPDKSPRIDGWQTAATTDPDTIKGWWATWPDSLIGMPLPKGTVAVDIDKPDLYAESGPPLPATASQKTPHGEHYLYQTKQDVPQTVAAYHPSLDTRVGGKGYVIAYEPDNIPSPTSWTAAPEWLYEEPKYKALAHGGQHAELVSLAGTLHNARKSPDEIKAVLWAVAKDFPTLRAGDPWQEHHIDTIVNGLESWEQRGLVERPERKFYSYDELLSANFPVIPQRIHGLLPAEGFLVIGGAAKAGKSSLMLQMAHCISAGIPFLGMATEQCPVIFVEEEGTAQGLRGRVRKQGKALGISGSIPLTISVKNRFRLDFHADVKELEALVAETGAKVILMGPLSQLSNIDENSNTEMGRLVRTLNDMSARLHILVGLAHHMRKVDQKLGAPTSVEGRFQALRGASALAGAFDTGIAVMREAEATEGSFAVMQREGESKNYRVKFDQESLTFDLDDSPAGMDKEAVKVFDYLWSRGQGFAVQRSEIEAATGLSRKVVENRLSVLIERGDVALRRDGDHKTAPWLYGVKAVSSLPLNEGASQGQVGTSGQAQ